MNLRPLMKYYISILTAVFCFSCHSFQERKASFFYDVEHGNTSSVKFALLLGMDVNTRYLGETALMKASTVEIAELLIRKGADIHAKDEYGKSVLMHVSEKKLDLVKYLISKKADVFYKTEKGNTVLMYATNPDVAKFLSSNLHSTSPINVSHSIPQIKSLKQNWIAPFFIQRCFELNGVKFLSLQIVGLKNEHRRYWGR